MADYEKYIEKAKNQALYEAKNMSHLSMELLKQSETNRRFNVELARWYASGKLLIGTFQEPYKSVFDGCLDEVVTVFRSVDGWSVQRAIEAEGQTVQRALNEEQKQKKGILGALGI